MSWHRRDSTEPRKIVTEIALQRKHHRECAEYKRCRVSFGDHKPYHYHPAVLYICCADLCFMIWILVFVCVVKVPFVAAHEAVSLTANCGAAALSVLAQQCWSNPSEEVLKLTNFAIQLGLITTQTHTHKHKHRHCPEVGIMQVIQRAPGLIFGVVD